MLETLISLIIAPLFVGLVLLLVDRWLDDQPIVEAVAFWPQRWSRNSAKKALLFAVGGLFGVNMLVL